jgi:protein-tyrosine-phosphatase
LIRPLQIAFVCTGNRARSPLAAALLRRLVEPDRVHVASFGTLERAGAPALAQAVSIARSLGVDLAGHRSRSLPAGGLHDQDLVVGFEPIHVSAAVAQGGAAEDKAFLLLELPGLLDRLPERVVADADESRALIEAMHRARLGRRLAPLPLDDPHGEPAYVMAEVARLIDTTVSHLASVLPTAGEDRVFSWR